jgi:ABC-2 type transport system ATP-binding protein
VVKYSDRTVVAGLDLEASTGELTIVLGPNGAGKTTTIEVCEGLRRRDAGSVAVLGLDPVRDAAALRSRVGVMLQVGGVWPATSPRRLLTHLCRLYANPLPVADLLDRLELDKVATTPYRRLSGGEQQKLELAAAIIGRPELVFLDEPTTGLDPASRVAIWQLCSDLRAAGVTIVMTTHLLDEAEHLADHLVVIAAGRVLASGTVADLAAAARDRARIRFRARPGLDMGDLAMRLPATMSANAVGPGQYEVTGPVDAQAAALVTAWCADQGVMPESLTTTASLADSYFQIVAAGGQDGN